MRVGSVAPSRLVPLLLAAVVAIAPVLLVAPPAAAASATVILRVQTDGAPPSSLGLQVRLSCVPRGGIPTDYAFTGASTQTIDVTGAERCVVSVTDTTGASTSVGVRCERTGKVTCENDTTARWALVGPDLGGTATFTITATYPPPTTESTTTTSPPPTTLEETTTTTEAATTTTGTEPPDTTTSVPPTLGTTTTVTTLAPVVGESGGSGSRLPLFVALVLAFVAVLGALVWVLVRGRGGADGDGPSGPSPSGPSPMIPPSIPPTGPPPGPYGPPPDPTPGAPPAAPPAPPLRPAGPPPEPPPTMPVPPAP